MTDCLFCKIANHTVPSIRVYEDDIVFVMMDIFPESKGHLLIIPKTHGENLFEMDDKVLAHVIRLSKTIAKAAKNALGADGIKIVQFNGQAAGQTVFHYHMHIVPAYQGVSFKRHAGQPADTQELQQLAEKIKTTLNT
ncbi:MAG: HIT family protein [Gammaproteobacteria bacterium]|nr:MAG: HIT family protein [Gammaproteobacteria bacterium]